MSLYAKLFQGDEQLQSLARSPTSPVRVGAVGAHVGRLQRALCLIEKAPIAFWEISAERYGPSTADAVLTYRTRRALYHAKESRRFGDDVDGPTLMALDRDMERVEASVKETLAITLQSGSPRTRPRSPLLLNFLSSLRVGAPAPMTAGNAVAAPPVTAPDVKPGFDAFVDSAGMLDLSPFRTATIEVSGAYMGVVSVEDPSIVRVTQDADALMPGDRALVFEDPQTFRVLAGRTLGRTRIIALAFDGTTKSLDVVVTKFPAPPKFVPGINHNHQPSKQWLTIRANPNNAPGEDKTAVDLATSISFIPGQLIKFAQDFQFNDKPVGLAHLLWYRDIGKGRDFNEDANIRAWIKADRGIRARLKKEIFISGRRQLTMDGHFEFQQKEYASQDFRYAFGGIDRIDFDVNPREDTVRVWFKDRYEWHPVYPGLYDLQSGDVVRGTNSVHAAAVELKLAGAADFWMVGVAEVPLADLLVPEDFAGRSKSQPSDTAPYCTAIGQSGTLLPNIYSNVHALTATCLSSQHPSDSASVSRDAPWSASDLRGDAVVDASSSIGLFAVIWSVICVLAAALVTDAMLRRTP